VEEASTHEATLAVAVAQETRYIRRVHNSRTALKLHLGSLLLAGLLLRLAR
jgi:hypothetical protein